jgi:hypothetical protein
MGEARERGLRQALKTVLATRFGPVSPAIETAIDAAGAGQLEAWIGLAATAASLEEVGILREKP